jgi:iron complex transport system ATP-binding protein
MTVTPSTTARGIPAHGAPADSTITFADVTLRYPRAPRDTVSSVSFTAIPKRITALVGPNGSGKSTLVRGLLGRIPRVAGAITVGNVDVNTLAPRDLAQRVAVVTQREESVFTRSVRDYIALGAYPHAGAWGVADDAPRVEEAARRADVADFLDRRTDELSGGEWQRVRIARALAQKAGALVLDEPTTFLDVAHEMAAFELLDGLARDGIVVLLVSHQLNLVARFAEQMVLLHRGTVAASGAPDDVMRGDVLESVYEWPLVVIRDPAVNAPALVPLRRRG